MHYDTLLQNATCVITKCDSYFITKPDRSLLQNVSGFFITKCNTFITKCDRYYKLRRFYYKMRQLLRNATCITNCDSTITFKVGSVVLSTIGSEPILDLVV